jgi:indole-3-glycerol phosphate synthase
MRVLDRILESKRREVEALHASDEEPPTARRATLDVERALRRPPGAPLRFISEIKRKSPSGGEIAPGVDAGARARGYAEGGAAMVSVLCDGPFFGGSWADVASARAALDGLSRDVPILAKEFILDEAQLDRARTAGADAVLLIARILSPARLRELHGAALAHGMRPLVEVVDEAEVAVALACDARVIGVNARDLDTLAMDAARAARVLEAIPEGRVRVHLSGIRTEDDVRAVARARVDAVLVGETLMREADPAPLLRRLVAAGA